MKFYFREGPKKVCHGQQLAEELLALDKLQQGDCAQVSLYIHNLAFIWLTDVLVLQLIWRCRASTSADSFGTLQEVDTGQLAITDA